MGGTSSHIAGKGKNSKRKAHGYELNWEKKKKKELKGDKEERVFGHSYLDVKYWIHKSNQNELVEKWCNIIAISHITLGGPF